MVDGTEYSCRRWHRDVAGCEETRWMPKIGLEFSVRRERQNIVMMLKEAVQQGRSDRRGEEVRTTLRVTVRPCSESWRTDKPLQYFEYPRRASQC